MKKELVGNYFKYCLFCKYNRECKLHHDEYQFGMILPQKDVCKGKIIYNDRENKLICQECETVLETFPENFVCRKFDPNPLYIIKKHPILKPRCATLITR